MTDVGTIEIPGKAEEKTTVKHDGKGLVTVLDEQGNVLRSRQFPHRDDAEAFMLQVALGVIP